CPAYTTTGLTDELVFCLSSVNSYRIDEDTKQIHITHKYYDQAEWLIYRIPIQKPTPQFVINISDLPNKIKRELEDLIPTPKTLEKVLIQAAGQIFENVNFRYYHLSVAKHLQVRLES
ncbi:MAG TPA: hypothetical protein VE076_13450, partial [Nitrososphaeraceae archaeon]|nr:hypothetical protein [Nitrososphaeraceae archaeon]